MNARNLEVAGFLAVLVFLALFARSAYESHEALANAQIVQTQQQKIIDAKQADIDARDKVTAQTIAQLTAQAAAVKTVPQATQVILKYLPAPAAGAPPAAIQTITRAELPAAEQAKLPDAPASTLYGVLTPDQLTAIAKNDLVCDANSTALKSCVADKQDLAGQVRSAQVKADAWKAVAKGGTKWQRFGRTMKTVGCAAGGAFAGGYLTKSSPSTGAAIGAGAGVTVCSFF